MREPQKIVTPKVSSCTFPGTAHKLNYEDEEGHGT